MAESEYILRDVKLSLQISKTISIDKYHTMKDIEKLAKELFHKFNLSDEHGYFICENEISSPDKLSVLKALDHFRTNEIVIKIKEANNSFRSYHQELTQQYKDETSSQKHQQESKIYLTKNSSSRSKETVTNAYNNLENIRKKILESGNTKDDYFNASELINKSEIIIENSKKILKNYNMNVSNNSERDNTSHNYRTEANFYPFKKNPEMNNSNSLPNRYLLSESNFTKKTNQVEKQLTDGFRRTDLIPKQISSPNFNGYNLDPFMNAPQQNNHRNTETINMTHASNQSLQSPQHREMVTEGPVRPEKPSRKMVSSKSPINGNKGGVPRSEHNSGIFTESQYNPDFQSNNVKKLECNDIWQLISFLEDEIKSDGKMNLKHMSQIVEHMTKEINKLYGKNLELTDKKDQLKKTLKQAQDTIHRLKKELEDLTRKLGQSEKSFEEQKMKNQQSMIQINEEVIKNFEYQLIIKDKEISKLNKHIANLTELNENSQKNIKDYEEYTAELNRTIDILKKKLDENEQGLNCQRCSDLTSKIELLKNALDDYTSKYELYCQESENDKKVLKEELLNEKQHNEQILAENQKLLLKLQEINNNIKTSQPYVTFAEPALENQNCVNVNSSLDFELYNINSRVNNLNLLLEEKDRIIDSLKQTNASLNEILEKEKFREKVSETNEEETQSLKQRAEKLVNENGQLMSENAELKQKIDQLTDQKSKELELLEREVNSLLEENHLQSAEEIAKKDKELEGLNNRINDLQIDLNQAKEAIAKHEEEMNKLNEEKNMLICKLNNISNTELLARKNVIPQSHSHRRQPLERLQLTTEESQSHKIMPSDENINNKLILLENDQSEEKKIDNNELKNLKMREGVKKQRNLEKEQILSKYRNNLEIELFIPSSVDYKEIIRNLEKLNQELVLKNNELKMMLDGQRNEEDKFKENIAICNLENNRLRKELNESKRNYDKLKIELDLMIKKRNTLVKPTNQPYSVNQSLEDISNSMNNSLIDSTANISNLKSGIKKSVTIKEGTTFLFTVFDNKRVLKFDLEYRSFKVFEFADYGDFAQHYNPPGSLYLNILDGLVIITGENIDLFFLYNYKKNSMNRISKLKDNHAYGGLVYYEEDNSLLCCSGWHNKRVERYVNSDLTFNFLHNKNENLPVKGNKTWTQLAEMNIERSECPFIILNKHMIYAFFGFNCPQMKYLDSIERIDLSQQGASWELVKYLNEKHVSTFRKNHSCVRLNENEVLFVGGYDGLNDVSVENFSFFNESERVFESNDRKFPEIVFNHIYSFQKHSFFVPFIDIKSKLHFASIDEKETVHVVEVDNLQYDIFKFDD